MNIVIASEHRERGNPAYRSAALPDWITAAGKSAPCNDNLLKNHNTATEKTSKIEERTIMNRPKRASVNGIPIQIPARRACGWRWLRPL
jgi:hypothetical protein